MHRSLTYFHVHLTHPTNRDPVGAGGEEEKLFLQLQRQRYQDGPEISAKKGKEKVKFCQSHLVPHTLRLVLSYTPKMPTSSCLADFLSPFLLSVSLSRMMGDLLTHSNLFDHADKFTLTYKFHSK